jgi:hypothetical protein
MVNHSRLERHLDVFLLSPREVRRESGTPHPFSLMSALGAQVNFSPLSARSREDRPKRLGMSRANVSSNSPKGCI